MSFFPWKKNLLISEREPTYKVRYLGNVQTAMMKGDGCVDKPVTVIWNNYVRSSNPGLEMKLTITSSGLKAYTKEQGLTEYRAHRISYCIAHTQFPRLFVWVYRHEGKKMKMELRCHAVICKTEIKAKVMAVQLHEKLSFALKEFMREKTRKQNSRLVLQRTNSLPQSGNVLPKRTQFLSTGQNFKPPISKSNTAPRLGAISEDFETGDDSIEEEDEEDETRDDAGMKPLSGQAQHVINPMHVNGANIGGICQRIIDLEMGNDIEELKQDESVKFMIANGDSDDESSESGFHEPEQSDQDADADVDDAEDDVSVNCSPLCDNGLDTVSDGQPADLVQKSTEVTSL